MTVGSAFIRVDFTKMKRVLDNDRFKIALAQGMFAAGIAIKEVLQKAAPEFTEPKPVHGWSPGSHPGTFKDSMKVLPMGSNMLWIISKTQSAPYIMGGHKTMSTPGQIRWMHTNYPQGYTSKHGTKGHVPPDMFAVEGMTLDAVAIQGIITSRIEASFLGGL